MIGWVDTKNETVHSIQIPGLLSFMMYGDWSKPVQGLDQVPRDEWPNVSFVFQTYHLMLYMWGMMFFTAAFGLFYHYKGTLQKKKWLLWTMVFSVLFPHIAQQAGWISTEVGRQPWIVWKLLKTSDGVSPNLSAAQVGTSLSMFIFIYLLLFALFLFLLDRKIKHGPEELEAFPEDQIYRNPYEVKP